jgi:hypothetical protein
MSKPQRFYPIYSHARHYKPKKDGHNGSSNKNIKGAWLDYLFSAYVDSVYPCRNRKRIQVAEHNEEVQGSRGLIATVFFS